MRHFFSFGAHMAFLAGKFKVSMALVALGMACGLSAHADPVTWVQWTGATSGNNGTATGSLALGTGVTVTYNGQVGGLEHDTNWQPASTYAGGTVSNAPDSAQNVWMTGGTPDTETITFSQAVLNPTMSFWSLGGQNNITESVNFAADDLFTIEACGPSAEIGGGCMTRNGQTLLGDEGNGTIQFLGNYSSISFTTPVYEYWFGFTVGAADLARVTPPPVNAATPEPSSLALLLTGASGLVGVARRRMRMGSAAA